MLPTARSERFDSVDTLRGFALLGILMINIGAFALPYACRDDPTLLGTLTTPDLIVWSVMQIVFSQKFLGIFSMLFGAGLILMKNRFEDQGRKLGGVYYRRIFWLLIIGLIHAYLIWHGDILVLYAICGLLLFLFRRFSSRKLIIIGVIVWSVMAMILGGVIFLCNKYEGIATEAQAELAAGGAITDDQQKAIEKWDKLQAVFDPHIEKIQEEITVRRSGYWANVKRDAVKTFGAHRGSLLLMIWAPLGMMLMGMGLMKSGVFTGDRSTKFYLGMIVIGYMIGLPVAGVALRMLATGGFVPSIALKSHAIDYLASIFVTMGHIGVVMLAVKKGWLESIRRRLAAVGRMALTNYLFHSICFTFVFYGFGIGLFGKVGYVGLMGFVLGMWTLQLIASPIWFRHFQIGPAEWVWRSLTYWRRLPIRH